MTKSKPRSRKRNGDVTADAVKQSSRDTSAASTLSRTPSFRILLIALASVGFFLRLINVLQTVELPTVVQLIGDARGYMQWALRIAAGNWYGEETFYQAPLYPYTLAVLIRFLGSGVFGIRFFQALLGAVSVFFVGQAGRRFFDQRVGLVAAAMYAVYPAAIYYDGIVQKTALASFLLCGLLALIAMFATRPRFGVAAGMGAVLGLLVLTRENALLWVPFLPLWILAGFRLPIKLRLAHAMAYGVGLGCVLLPVAARNASLGGEWSPTTFQAGPNFYIGNHLQSNGVYQPLVPGHETPMYERADAQRLAEQATGRELTSREVSRFWAEKTFAEIRQDPSRWLQLMALKSLMVVNHFEVPDVESMRVYRDYSWPLRLLAPIWHFGILAPLAIWGLVVRRHEWKRLSILYLLMVVMAAAVVLFFILGRYRQPLVPMLVLFAAAGAIDLVQKIRQGEWRAMRAPALAALVTLVICHLPVHDESMLHASSYMNVGVAAGQAGNMAVSIEALKHAVQEHPEMPEAHFNLGRAFEVTNRLDLAIVFYQNALKLDPNLVMVDARLGQVYEQVGDFEKARVHYRRAVAINPQDEASRAALARLQQAG